MPKGVYPRTEWHREINRRGHAGQKVPRGARTDGQPFQGRYVGSRGYVCLSSRHDHPLADVTGVVLEHRAVLYEKLGPGSHPCHWCDKELEWKHPERSLALMVDHLNDDKQDNQPENLVPSCLRCNWGRSRRRDERYRRTQQES